MPVLVEPSIVPGIDPPMLLRFPFTPIRALPTYLQPYPARRTVLSFPNHGSDQLNPTEGAKLLLSSPQSCFCGFGEFLPTNSTVVRGPHEIPHSPATPPTGAPAIP